MNHTLKICTPFSDEGYIQYRNSYIYFTFMVKTMQNLNTVDFNGELILNRFNDTRIINNMLVFNTGTGPTIRGGIPIEFFEYNMSNGTTPNSTTTQTLPVIQINPEFFTESEQYFDNNTNYNYLRSKGTMMTDNPNAIWIIIRAKIDEDGIPEIIFNDDFRNKYLKFDISSIPDVPIIAKHWYLEYPEFHAISNITACNSPVDVIYDDEDTQDRKICITCKENLSPRFYDDYYTVWSVNHTMNNGIISPNREYLEWQKNTSPIYNFVPSVNNKLDFVRVDNLNLSLIDLTSHQFNDINNNHKIDVGFKRESPVGFTVITEIDDTSTGTGTITNSTSVINGANFNCFIITGMCSAIESIFVSTDMGASWQNKTNGLLNGNYLPVTIIRDTIIKVKFVKTPTNIHFKGPVIHPSEYQITINDDQSYINNIDNNGITIPNYTDRTLKVSVKRIAYSGGLCHGINQKGALQSIYTRCDGQQFLFDFAHDLKTVGQTKTYLFDLTNVIQIGTTERWMNELCVYTQPLPEFPNETRLPHSNL